MKSQLSLLARFFSIVMLAVFALFIGCKESSIEPESTEPTTDTEAMLKLAEEDSAVASFEPSYNEEDAMSFLGKTEAEIYPFKVGHRVRLVNRNLSVDFVGDTAYGTLTKTFEGTLIIAASYNSGATQPDTVVKKPFTSVITKKIIFVRRDSTRFPYRNWKIAAISLPEGGVLSQNIDIKKLTAFLPNGDTLVINSPNSYFLSRGWGWWRQLPIISKNQPTTIKLEVYSAYADTDFVTLTYGADIKGFHRAKKRFVMTSSVPSGNGYDKTYEQTYTSHQFVGHYHAIINALPKQVIYDDATLVESETWGMPYFIKP
ncbi:MAG: hypothetical protein HXY50_06225 [Ignavibacteriaceae bacterium]|nr:hypothetical protein [Ignavibacteriaceae bacterium]